jgi:uncharacterized protein (TIGR02594 family)
MEPKWLDIAMKEKGVKETPGAGSTSRIDEYLETVGISDDETPWCSAFMNWVMKEAGIKGTVSPAAQSWMNWGESIREPKVGAIVVLERGSEKWMGHVGIVTGTFKGHISVLGGNQNNMVCETVYPMSKVLGYRWPRGFERRGNGF